MLVLVIVVWKTRTWILLLPFQRHFMIRTTETIAISGWKSVMAAKASMLRSATVAKVVDIMTLICPRRHSKDLRPWELDKSKFRGALCPSRGNHEDYHGQIPSRDIFCPHRHNRASKLYSWSNLPSPLRHHTTIEYVLQIFQF